MAIEATVVIPTCDRRERLKECLESLFNQDYDIDNLEIVVVDDRDNPKTKDMVNALSRQRSQLKYISQEHKGPASARNLGVKASLGRIICFVDDDCVVDKNWVKFMVQAHRNNPEIVVVGGKTLTPSEKTSVLVSQFLSTCSIESCVGGKKEVIFFPTCNVSFKRAVFDKYELDEKFPLPGGEDLEFFWRLFKGGYRFIWDKRIEVIHHRDDTFLSFMKQAYIYGRGNFLVQYLHKDHPLLHELKTDRKYFWLAISGNILKMFRFSQLLGRMLIQQDNIKSVYKKSSIYIYFIYHKIFYIIGNISEYLRTKQ